MHTSDRYLAAVGEEAEGRERNGIINWEAEKGPIKCNS